MMSISSVASHVSTAPSNISTDSTCSCHNCGATQVSQLVAQKRIEELEEQVKEYSMKAAQAADRLERSQSEIIQLKRQSAASEAATAIISPTPTTPPPRPSTSAASRIGAFLARSASTTTAPTLFLPPASRDLASEPSEIAPPLRSNSMGPMPTGPTLQSLEAQLNKERVAREKAEKQLNDVKGELEDLSVTLFQQANEMVATERKGRAKLEERLAHLEKKDMETRARLERLEKALQRIQRVRGLLTTKPVV